MLNFYPEIQLLQSTMCCICSPYSHCNLLSITPPSIKEGNRKWTLLFLFTNKDQTVAISVKQYLTVMFSFAEETLARKKENVVLFLYKCVISQGFYHKLKFFLSINEKSNQVVFFNFSQIFIFRLVKYLIHKFSTYWIFKRSNC